MQAHELASEAWRAMPCLTANHLTNGRFKRYEHIQYISRALTPALINGGGKFIVSVPPRHGKSFLISLWVPTWYLHLFPEKNVILSSYEADFAANWGRQVRNLITEYKYELGISLADDSTAADRWNTSEGGGMVTAGVGGPITGRGGHLLIVDDPVKNYEQAMSETYREKTIEWFQSTLFTRAEPGASIVILMTRWHERDLAGFLLKEHKDQWTEINLPAIAEANDPLGRIIGQPLCTDRYNQDALEEIKKSVGSRVWNALYQQRPTAQEGNILKREWFHLFDNIPTDFDECIQSWDLSFTGKATSDFVVGQVWMRKGSNKYLIDMVRGRMTFTETVDAIEKMRKKWPQAPLILVENKANGPAIESLLGNKISGIVLWEPQGDKVSRANAVSPQFEAGNVHIANRTWTSDLIEESVSFPNASNDDQVDAMTMALLRLEQYAGGVGTLGIIRRSW